MHALVSPPTEIKRSEPAFVIGKARADPMKTLTVPKLEQAEKNKAEVEEWLEVVNARHDVYMKNARKPIVSVLDSDSFGKLYHTFKKSSAFRTTSNASTLELILAKLRREEIEEENKAAAKIAENTAKFRLF